MIVTCETREGTGVVSVSGGMTAITAGEFREKFNDWFATTSEAENVVVDLGQVETMDSSGLGAIIASLKRVTEGGGDMRICCLQKKPRLVFEITRAYKMFDIYDSIEEALASFK